MTTPTALDDAATLVIRGPVGEVLEAVVPRKFKTVVFDLGNVLIGWDPYGAVRGTLTPQQWETFVVETDFGAFNQRADAGEKLGDLIEEMTGIDPAHGAILSQYFDRFALALTGPIPGSTEVVRELAKKGYQTLGLTNWAAETFVHAAGSAPVVDELDGIVVSGQIGLSKPDAAIFEYLVDEYALDPREAIFVDDSLVNVDAARALGLHAILFEDAAGLRAELEALGVL